MTHDLPAIRAWNLGEISRLAALVRSDADAYEHCVDDLRTARDNGVQDQSGDAVEAAGESCTALCSDLAIFAETTRGVGDLLAAFATNAEGPHARLIALHDEALSRGFVVEDDGGVHLQGPPQPQDPDQKVATGMQEEMCLLLGILTRLDVDAANHLRELGGEVRIPPEGVPDYGNNFDVKGTAAATALSVATDSFAAAVDADDALGASAKGLSRAAKVFGPGAGLAIGILGAPEGEDMTETLVAEGGGALAAIATSAATGFVLGSEVPILGNIVGFVGGAAVGWLTSAGIRCDYDKKRYEKVVPE